jgi:hypothetical protein
MSRFGVVIVVVFVALSMWKASGRWPRFGAEVLDTTLLSLLVFITTTAVLGGL